MNSYYKDNYFDEIFCYFFETYSHIHKTLENIPRFIPKNEDNKTVSNFINHGINLVEKSYGKEIFKLLFDTFYAKACKNAINDIEKEKIILSYMVINLIYENKFLPFLDTIGAWSQEANEYLLFDICPKLPVNWRREYLTVMNIL